MHVIAAGVSNGCAAELCYYLGNRRSSTPTTALQYFALQTTLSRRYMPASAFQQIRSESQKTHIALPQLVVSIAIVALAPHQSHSPSLAPHPSHSPSSLAPIPSPSPSPSHSPPSLALQKYWLAPPH